MLKFDCKKCGSIMGHVGTYFQPYKMGVAINTPFSRFECLNSKCRQKAQTSAIYKLKER